jgi:hypothetical protein
MGGTERMRALARAVVAATIVAAAAVPVGARVAGAVDPVAQPSISVPDVVVGESEGSVTVPVTLNAPGLSTVTVQYSNSNGSAANNNDYTAVAGTLTFDPGQMTKNVVVPILNDAGPEGFETFTLNLGNPTSSVISKATAQIAVVDNDTIAATPVLYARDVTVDESSGSATVVVMLGGPAGRASAGTVTASYTATNIEATAGSDYTATSGAVTFTAGQTVKRITVPITDDAGAEAPERFRFTLSSPSGATLGDADAVVTIGASDGTPAAQPTIATADLIVGETDGYVDVPITLNRPGLTQVSVQLSNSNGTATNNNDYLAVGGTLRFEPGETTRTLRIPVLDDTAPEGFETFVVNVGNPTNAVLSAPGAWIGVVDNDTIAATPALYARDVTVDETARFATVTVLLGGPAGRASTSAVTAAYTTANIEATAGSDYTTASGVLRFNPGQTVKHITVPITDDASTEAAERLRVTLSSPSGATLADTDATVTIGASDGSAAAQPAISVPDITTGEIDGYLDVPVSLDAPGVAAVTVQYSNSNGSATNNNDYLAVAGTLRFDPGQTTRVVRVPILDDTNPEDFGTFTFNLANAGSAVLSAPGAWIGIVDDDTTVATPAIHARDVIVDESGRFARVPVFVGGAAGQGATAPITVGYTTTTTNLEATAGSDFTTTSGTLRFNPGQTVKHVTVPITNDGAAEGSERFRVTLSGPSGATLGRAAGTVTIAANDTTAVAQPTISTADVITHEGDGYLDVPITLSAPGTNPVTVQYSNTNGTAFNNSDYFAVAGTVRFAPGETVRVIRIPILDANVVTEPVELFTLNLANPSSAVLARPTVRINIVDDDAAGFTASYTTNYSNAELPRLQQSAAYMQMSVEELQKTGIGLFIFLFALSNPRPAPEVAAPPSLAGPNAFTTQWTAADITNLWEVQAQYGLTPEQAQKFGVNLITFLLILGGN